MTPRRALTLTLFSCLAACTSASGPAGSTHPTSIANACINPIEIAKQDIISDKEIRFTMRGGDVWVNELPYACFGLKSEAGFEWSVEGTLVCSNQQSIKVLRQGTPCMLGDFKRAPKTPTT